MGDRMTRAESLGVLQEPLEQGSLVGSSPPMGWLRSGLVLAIGLVLFTVAQQGLQEFSHPPLPLSEPLDHCWELEGQTECRRVT